MFQLRDKVIIITGSSMGIGAELATQCAHQGAHVVLTARSVDKLKSLAQHIEHKGGDALVIPCDVTRPEQIQHAIDETLKKWKRIDVLINNAGYGMSASFESVPIDQVRKIFETNVFGVITFIQRVIPIMKKQGCGTIVNIESIVGLRATPQNSFYSSTKHALHALSEALRTELFRDRIHVLSVCPGLIKTEFTHNKFTVAEDPDSPPPWLYMPARDCAFKIIKAIQRQKRQIVITGHGKLIALLQRVSPGFLDFVFSRDYRKLIKR
jgi:short-subunit dehydrogenase